MSFCVKIRRVRFKHGGEVRVLDNPREVASKDVEGWLRDELSHHVQTADNQLAGAVLVTWLANGGISAGCKVVNTSPYVGASLPHLVADGVRSVQRKIAIDRAFGR